MCEDPQASRGDACDDDCSDSVAQCSICFNDLVSDVHELEECGHRYHTACIVQWFRSKHDTCPLCRKLPRVQMKLPDVFHRAKSLIALHARGLVTDPVLIEKIGLVHAADDRERILRQELQDVITAFKNVTVPEKQAIIKEYRAEKKRFKEKTTPMLKLLDKMDSDDRKARREKKRQIGSQRKLKREAMRDIGMHNA